jgi:carotenoid 1,2-hydratase
MLHSPAQHPDAWHNVIAPGGYEWWYFDAEDANSDTQIVAILLDGFVFHPGYLRRHARYLRNPNRNAPAQPRDFPCAYFMIYENGKPAAQFMTQYAPGSLIASADRPDVTLGPNSLRSSTDGYQLSLSGAPWQLTARGPVTHHDSTLSVDWSLSPISSHAPAERHFLSHAMTGAEHHWVLAAPHCRFSADISLTGPKPRSWKLTGHAYHDHNYGLAPLGPGLAHWIWGRALFPDACYTFHYAVPRNRKLAPEPHLVKVTPQSGIHDISPAASDCNVDWMFRTSLMLSYPSQLQLGPMTLRTPRIIDSTPFYLRLAYIADCDGRIGSALCEVAYPHRLRWPILGRMIEMSFDKRLTPPHTHPHTP